MFAGEFQLPVAFDLTATFLFAITGTLAGMRRHYDIIGVFVLAFTAALGGGLIRDGIFISAGPPVAMIGTILIGHIVPPVRRILSSVPTGKDEGVAPLVKLQPSTSMERPESAPRSVFERLNLEQRLARTYVTVLSLVDALGLGIYAVVGAQKSLDHGLPVGAAILVGAVNASGGGLLRDVLAREVPLLFQPGQFYALTAVVGTVVFVTLLLMELADIQAAAFIAIGSTFLLRVIAIRFDWRSPAMGWDEQR